MEVLIIAQLIKLKDYISRYEWNPYHYPSQYIKLKKDNWRKLHHMWVNQEGEDVTDIPEVKEESTFEKIKSFIKQDNVEEITEEPDRLPEDEMELKQYFLDKLFPFQLKWATSTVTDVSFVDRAYHYDPKLTFFLQRFPDIYCLMYEPIFKIKQATVDAEIILISPIGIDVITLLEDDDEAIRYLAGDERTWIKETLDEEINIISPLIGLKRTEHIIKSILNSHDIDFPINKIVMSRKNNIVFSSEPYQTRIVGKYQFEKWLTKKRNLKSTLKSQQLKVIDQLLKYCLTSSAKRPEWEEDATIFTTDREE